MTVAVVHHLVTTGISKNHDSKGRPSPIPPPPPPPIMAAMLADQLSVTHSLVTLL